MSWLSVFLKNFRYDPVKGAAARAASSTNPVTQAIGIAATQAVNAVANDIATGLNSHNSNVGIANAVIGDVETAFKVALDAFVEVTVGQLPVVGGAVAPFAVQLANSQLDLAEQHLLTYVTAHFGATRAAVNIAPAVTAEQVV